MNIKKGDKVLVLTGKDKGKKGTVVSVSPKTNRAIVEGVNVRMRHVKSKKKGEAGQKVEVPMTIHISNIQIVDPKTGKGTRIGTKMVKDKKVRIAKKSGQEI